MYLGYSTGQELKISIEAEFQGRNKFLRSRCSPTGVSLHVLLPVAVVSYQIITPNPLGAYYLKKMLLASAFANNSMQNNKICF